MIGLARSKHGAGKCDTTAMPFLRSVAPALPPCHQCVGQWQMPGPRCRGSADGEQLSGDRAAAGREGAAAVPILPRFLGGPVVLGARGLFRLPVKPSQPRANLHGTAGAGETGASYQLGVKLTVLLQRFASPTAFSAHFLWGRPCCSPPVPAQAPRCGGGTGRTDTWAPRAWGLQRGRGGSAMLKLQHSHPPACSDARAALLAAASAALGTTLLHPGLPGSLS